MRRLLTRVLALMTVAAGPVAAQQQEVVGIHLSGDTAVALVPGDTATVNLYWGSFGYQLQQIRVALVFDTMLLSVVGVAPNAPLANVQVVPGPNGVAVRGDGFLSYGTNQVLFPLRVVLKAAGTNGLYLYTRVDSLGVPAQNARLAAGAIARFCHATYRYGDVDGDTKVDSRDALITLSAAVGLPVGGFPLANGDVDGDGLANSRDALMMLSWSIQLPVPQAVNLGRGIPDACPGFSPPGEDLVFVGDTGTSGPEAVRRLAAASTTPVTVPLPVAPAAVMGEPRLAANGTSVVYSCYDGVSPQICRAETDGSGFLQLTTGGPYARNGDWSPSGLEVAYTAQVPGSIRRVNADGTGDSTVASVSTGQNPYVAWSRTGTQLAYSTSSGLFVVDRYGVGGTIGISPVTFISPFDLQRWSPAGDSIAFTTGYSRGIWAVPSAGGTSVGAVRLGDMGLIFDWGPPGFVFSYGSSYPGFEGLWLMTPAGALHRLTGGQADRDPAFRRNP